MISIKLTDLLVFEYLGRWMGACMLGRGFWMMFQPQCIPSISAWSHRLIHLVIEESREQHFLLLYVDWKLQIKWVLCIRSISLSLFFYWGIIDLQCCVSAVQQSGSVVCIHTPLPLEPPPTSLSIPPVQVITGLWAELTVLYTAASQ